MGGGRGGEAFGGEKGRVGRFVDARDGEGGSDTDGALEAAARAPRWLGRGLAGSPTSTLCRYREIVCLRPGPPDLTDCLRS